MNIEPKNKMIGSILSENDLFMYIFNIIKVIMKVGTALAKK